MTDPLASSIRPYARTAYAQGWAASGGPMTDRVKAGCVAAVKLAEDNAHHPEILEVVLDLGHLEGVWATIFERRHRLIVKFHRRMMPLWREAVADADVAGAVEMLRQSLGLAEAFDPQWVRRAKAEARAAAVRLLSWLPGKGIWQRMRDVMRMAIQSGRAEGYADALAIAAQGEKRLGLDFDIAFDHAYAALENLGELWAESDPWLNKMLGRAADEFGRTLGDLAASGADYEQMVAAGIDVLQLTAEDSDAVSFMTDWALSTGLSRGALDLYASEGVQQVSWLTAGDGRVCEEICEPNGQKSPFNISDFPTMPGHPLCRCVASAEFSLDSDAFDKFFP